MKLGKKTSRHPGVVDLLGGAPTAGPSGAARSAPLGGPDDPPPMTAPAAVAGDRPTRGPAAATRVLVGVAALAAVVAGGVVVATAFGGDDQPASPAAAAEASQGAVPILDLPDHSPAPASPEVDDQCRADRGDQRSGAGVIAAWNHAYYSQRNAVAARALATENSSVVPADQLQRFIDEVPIGTNYCVRTTALSEDVYLVDLSELRPDGAQRITQTVTTAKIDGKWFVDVFN